MLLKWRTLSIYSPTKYLVTENEKKATGYAIRCPPSARHSIARTKTGEGGSEKRCCRRMGLAGYGKRLPQGERSPAQGSILHNASVSECGQFPQTQGCALECLHVQLAEMTVLAWPWGSKTVGHTRLCGACQASKLQTALQQLTLSEQLPRGV